MSSIIRSMPNLSLNSVLSFTRIFYFLKKSLEIALTEAKILFNLLSQRVLNILFFC